MADLSNYSFTGRLVKDAEFKTFSSGKQVLEMSVAVNVGFGDRKSTNWIKAQQWGERGKKLAEYLVKGSLIAATGELQVKEWESNGKSGTDLTVNVQNLALLQSKKDASSEENPQPTEEDVVF